MLEAFGAEMGFGVTIAQLLEEGPVAVSLHRDPHRAVAMAARATRPTCWATGTGSKGR